MTETEIIEGCCKNDRRCQEALFRRYFPSMLSVCLRYTQDRQKATEIVNNGFLKVFKKIENFRNEGSFEGWVRRIVVHSVSDFFRANSGNQIFTAEDALQKEFILPDVYSKLYIEDLLELSKELPPATKVVFDSFVLGGLSHEEIAKSCHISVGTSKWHLSQARKILQLIIQKNYPNESYA